MPTKKVTKKEIREKLQDRRWRMNNLYYIKNKQGEKVLFKMNAIQEYIHDNLWFMSIVPKARQLGITTFFCLLYLDQVLFSENKTCTIIAHTEKDMKKIFRNKIVFAWEHLHPWLKEKIGDPSTRTAYEFSFPNGGVISVSLSSRSDTVNFLHISEFGKICAKYPDKADEIVKGAINSVEQGQFVSIESTAEGAEGHFYEFCMEAEKLRKEGQELTPLDFKIFFFPWWINDEYRLEGDVKIPQEKKEYFDTLEKKYDIRLDDEQKAWYVKKEKIQKDGMFAEYPSTLEEAFKVNTEGAYFKKQMDRVYLQNRITSLPHDPMLETHTWWDLGMNDFNVIGFVQFHGAQIRFIDLYYSRNEPLSHYYEVLAEKKADHGYRYGKHVLPFDVEVTELGTGVTRKETLYKLGMRNIVVAKKVGIQDGIDRVRTLFPRFWFDEERTQKLYQSLANYRKDFDKKLGVQKNKPRHDANSHFADMVRTGCQLYREPHLGGNEWGLEDETQEQGSQSFFHSSF